MLAYWFKMILKDVDVLVQLLVKGFLSVQNVIKTKSRNHLNAKHLEIVLKVAIERPSNDFGHILVATIEIWQNSTR
jgi:hypothetical protein